MIIISAVEAIKSCSDPKKLDDTCFRYGCPSGHPVWDIYRYLFNGDEIFIAWEESFYGRLCRQFMINGSVTSDREDKYMPGHFLSFDCSNGLCAKVPFEHNSVTYDQLLKRYGFPVEPFMMKNGWQVLVLMHDFNNYIKELNDPNFRILKMNEVI